jgi:hypothetical protein
MDMSSKHTMKTGTLVRLASNLLNHNFCTEESWHDTEGMHITSNSIVRVDTLDIGLVVDDLIEEEEEYYLLVMFNEQIVRADCRTLRRVK